MKRILCVNLICVFLLMMQMPTARAVGTSASAAVLMDKSSGRVLYECNARTPRPIASTTKLMTALVALESGRDLEENVIIRPEWTGVEGSSLYLHPGECVTLKELLYGMLLNSGNDAAMAVAGYCGGTVEDFVAAMNEKAAGLGMRESRFADPSGLDDEGNHSTAYDMALLAAACLEREELAEILAARTARVGSRIFTNHNKLLWRYEGCVGLKTGYTKKAGRTLVSAAERDGMTLLCVTLQDPDDWADHERLFDYGFSAFSLRKAVTQGGELCRIPVEGSLLPFCTAVADGDFSCALGETEHVSVVPEPCAPVLSAPVRAGDTVGCAAICLNGEVLAYVDLVARESCFLDIAPKAGLWERILN